MESGAFLGVVTSIASLAVVGWLIQRFFEKSPSWASWFRHIAATLAWVGAVCGGAAVLAKVLNVSDSSHGFMTLGLPVMLSFARVIVSVIAITIGTVKAGRA